MTSIIANNSPANSVTDGLEPNDLKMQAIAAKNSMLGNVLRTARIAAEGPMLSMANLRTFLLGDSAILFKMNPGTMQWSG